MYNSTNTIKCNVFKTKYSLFNGKDYQGYSTNITPPITRLGDDSGFSSNASANESCVVQIYFEPCFTFHFFTYHII